MKFPFVKHAASLIALIGAFFAAAPSHASPVTVTVYSLGDTVVSGWHGDGSYRRPLWYDLIRDGYTNISFVGNQMDPPAPKVGDWPPFHDGRSGWTVQEILNGRQGQGAGDDHLAGPSGWAQRLNPDLVIIHAGTSDLRKGKAEDTAAAIGAVIDTLRAANEHVKIVLCKIIPDLDYPTKTRKLNALIPGLIDSKNTSDSPIVLCDLSRILDPARDFSDSEHPNERGSKKIAEAIERAVRSLLGPAPATPASPDRATYISDLMADSQNAGLQAWANDRSPANYLIQVQGRTYSKGISAAPADSETSITYHLGGRFARFTSDIGIDDAVRVRAAATGAVLAHAEFIVYADDHIVYDSGAVTEALGRQTIDVDVSGVKTLRLAVRPAKGYGGSDDWADWADARLYGSLDDMPIAVPADASAYAGDGQTTLDWTPVTGATGYDVYRGDLTGCCRLYKSDVQPPFTDAGLDNGTVYYYQIAAVRNGAEEGLGRQIHARPLSGPFEAEECELSGDAHFGSEHRGYVGAGYVELNDSSAMALRYSAKADGAYVLGLRYANGSGATRRISLYVNGVKAKPVELAPIGSWDLWGTVGIRANLQRGANGIEFRMEDGDGPAPVVFDSVTIVPYTPGQEQEAQPPAASAPPVSTAVPAASQPPSAAAPSTGAGDDQPPMEALP